MDPLHPLVPIQPSPPTPPDYRRIQRIERDHSRDAEPDWQHPSDEDEEESSREEQFEDDYDPKWSDTTAAEAYNDHGVLTDNPGAGEPAGPDGSDWNPRRDGERRSPQPPSADPDDPDEPGEPGGHIDIIA